MNKIFANTVFLSASQIASRLISFLFFVFAARYLGVKNFGIYVFTISFVYNFIPVADFGIERFVLRDISREPEKENWYISRLIPLRLFLGISAYLLLLVFGVSIGLRSENLLYLAVFGLALIPYNLTFLLISFTSAKEKMHFLAATNVLLVLLTVLLGFVAIELNLGISGILFAYPVACTVLACASFFKPEIMKIKLSWSVDIGFVKHALAQSWIFGAFTIIAVFYLRSTLILVNLINGPESGGIYGSVFKFVEAIILIPQSLALALFPLTSRLFAEDHQKLRHVYLKSLVILFFISLPFLAAMLLFPREIVLLAYGPKYLAAANVLPVLGLSLVLFFVNALPGNIIQNSPRVKNYLPFAVLIFVFVLCISLLLIPKFSYVGAAWSVVIGEAFGCIISNIFVFKFLKSD